MAKIEAKLSQMGLALPAPLKPPAGLKVPIAMVKITGNHAYVSGHAPLAADGSLADPKGKVGGDLTVEQGYQAARLTALAMLASLKRELHTRSAVGMAALPFNIPVEIEAEVEISR